MNMLGIIETFRDKDNLFSLYEPFSVHKPETLIFTNFEEFITPQSPRKMRIKLIFEDVGYYDRKRMSFKLI